MWMIAVYLLVGILVFRQCLWEKDKNGNWRREISPAMGFGVAWPVLLLGGLVYFTGWGIWKALSIPGYYFFTPHEVRKSKAN